MTLVAAEVKRILSGNVRTVRLLLSTLIYNFSSLTLTPRENILQV